MSYTQFGYSYPSSSQILMTGQHPTATPCCQSANSGDPHSGGGQPSPAAAAAAAVCTLPAAYDSRLLSTFPRLATGLAVNGLYGSSYADQGYVATLGTGSSAFYSSLPSPYDLKESRTTWGPLPQATAGTCYPYDPTLAAYGPYGDRYGAMDSVARRKNATRETTNTLKAWLYEHRKNPYPTKGEKIMLAIITKMTLTQVSTWFANARRRLKKENKMTWEPRNKSGESADTDDKGDNSCSPPPCDSLDRKSREDSLDGSQDEESQDLQVKSECKPNVNKQTEIQKDIVSCSVKSESSDLLPNDCLSLTLGNYDGHHQQHHPHHHHSHSVCSPSSDSRPCGTPSPVHPHHLHHPNQHHPHLSDRLCSEDPMTLDVVNGVHPGDRPKIWSLAHTATSDSPPMLRRSGSLSQMVMSAEGYVMMGSVNNPCSSSVARTGSASGGSSSASASSFSEVTAAAADVAAFAQKEQQSSDTSAHSSTNGTCWINGGVGELKHKLAQSPATLTGDLVQPETVMGSTNCARDCAVVSRSGSECCVDPRTGVCIANNNMNGELCAQSCKVGILDCTKATIDYSRCGSEYRGTSADFTMRECSGNSRHYGSDLSGNYTEATKDCNVRNIMSSAMQTRCSSPSNSSGILPGKTIAMFDPRLNADESDMFVSISQNSTTHNSTNSKPSRISPRLDSGIYGMQLHMASKPSPVTSNVEYSRQSQSLSRGQSSCSVDDGCSPTQPIAPMRDLTGSVMDSANMQGHAVAEQKDYVTAMRASPSLGNNLSPRYSTTAFRPISKIETTSS